MARNAVLLKIKSLMPSLSAKEKRVADFILDQQPDPYRMTIVKIFESRHRGLDGLQVHQETRLSRVSRFPQQPVGGGVRPADLRSTKT